MKKQILCLSLCLIMCFALFAGCSNTPAAETTAPPAGTATPDEDIAPEGGEFAEELTFTIMAIPVVDPCNSSTTAASSWGYDMLYDTLVYYSLEGTYEPSLATSWETADCQNYTFYLRDDVYFHNGEHFTAQDVANQIDRAKDSLGSTAYDKYNKVDTYNIVNDYEIEVTLNQVDVDFINDMSSPFTGIQNKKAIENDPDKGPWIGTGPWILDEFVSNDHLAYLRNDDYWGELPVTKKLNFKTIAEASVAQIMLENGDIQGTMDIPAIEISQIESNPDYVIYPYVGINTQYVAFNQDDPLMADINFRMAVAHAIKRDSIVDISRNGYGIPVSTGTFWGNGTEYAATDIPIIPYDLDKAREYLEASIYNGETVEIVAAGTYPLKNAECVMEQLAEIGINTTVFQTDQPGMSAYTAYSNNQAQMVCYTGSWSVVASSSRNFLYPEAASNRARYNNQEVTELLDQATAEVDNAKREEIYRRVQEIVAEEIPYIGLFNVQENYVCQKGVGGIKFFPSSAHDFSYVYMVKQ